MKARILLILLSILCLKESQAQVLKLSTNHLAFPTLNEKQTDSLSFTITNPTSYEAIVDIVQPFRVFGSQPFWTKENPITIEGNSSRSVWVYCRIVHNTPNPSNLILKTTWGPLMLDAGDLSIKLSCQGKYSKLYYSTTQNLSEEALKVALKTRINLNANAFSYNVARDKMYDHIDNLNDSITCIYTNRKAKFNTRAGATANNFNCEHTFPQGFFSSASPMVSDLHHLFSTDENANNSRGNLPFGIATAPFVSPTLNAPSLNGGGKYEPQDSHKGNCARAMMYFVLRHGDFQNFYSSQDAILRTWHRSTPPLPKDTARNAAVFADQNNRNPFVDYPQFEARIKNLLGTSQSDSVQKIGISNSSVFWIVTPDTMSLVIWNEGNKKVLISNLHFKGLPGTTFDLIGGSNQSFSLGYNESRVIRYVDNSDNWTTMDSLIFNTNNPTQPHLGIELTFSSEVSVNPLSRNLPPSLFPNPASSMINLDLRTENNSVTQIRVLNMQGQAVQNTNAQPVQGKIQISVSELPAGIYQVEIKQNQRTDHLRFVKN
jgi:endonuclease I